MPFYEFKCTNRKCSMDLFEEMQLMNQEHKADCPDCGRPARRKYHFGSKPIITFRAGYHPGLGEYVNSRKEEDNLTKKYGLRRKT